MNTEHDGLLGHAVPPFQLQDENGETRSSEGLYGEHGLLLVFVRGTWCSQCVATLYFLARYAKNITQLGVNIAIVAIDDVGALQSFKISASLPIDFPLLADKEETVHQRFNITTREKYLLLDNQGVVKETFTDPDGYHRPSSPALVEAIKTHLLSTTSV